MSPVRRWRRACWSPVAGRGRRPGDRPGGLRQPVGRTQAHRSDAGRGLAGVPGPLRHLSRWATAAAARDPSWPAPSSTPIPNIADQIAVIDNGKNGGMPAWKGTLSATQIRDVAMYERQCLGRQSC